MNLNRKFRKCVNMNSNMHLTMHPYMNLNMDFDLSSAVWISTWRRPENLEHLSSATGGCQVRGGHMLI